MRPDTYIGSTEEQSDKAPLGVNVSDVSIRSYLQNCSVASSQLSKSPSQCWERASGTEVRRPLELRGLLERLGYGVAVQRVVGDQPEPLRQALLALAEDCDVVVSTGGVSAGDDVGGA